MSLITLLKQNPNTLTMLHVSFVLAGQKKKKDK